MYPTAAHRTGTPSPHADRTAGGPVPHAGGVNEEQFRAAMARLAGGVVLVTAFDPEDGPHGAHAGMTATAFVSVSLDPPLVLLSVRTGSRMDEVLERAPLWAANLLAEDQRPVAGRFSMKGRLSDRLLFSELPHVRGEASGAPLVDGALAALECRTEQRHTAGDHTLLVARVVTAAVPSGPSGPLTYYQGRYRTLG
ncbi:flavin reductase family protein [Streptomyces sp. TRM 70351]|uniref:flavin reductase family protein n=1 Tax=Streptomyces sp. TRM 70351 TaxID=3116552 RepID=UPI002E7C55A7|nr:flavin reductase family protein [Streptomyces sp. TRM 70351]MEE1929666.1 flavin reductase family protein [Streptomyces sp. TRM 70351]